MNQRFRKVVFWLHLTAGVVAGSVILVMSVTGTLLMYERQITEWADRRLRSAPTAGAARLGPEALLARATAARPDATPSGLTVQADPAAPAAVSLGRGRNLYLDPYTGEVLGEGAPQVRAFFRWSPTGTAGSAPARRSGTLGRAVTGACNLAFWSSCSPASISGCRAMWTRAPGAQRRLVPARSGGQGAGLQLAQRDRSLGLGAAGPGGGLRGW